MSSNPTPGLLAYIFARTEKTIAHVHAASKDDVDKAVRAAKAALDRPSWKLLPGTERGILMSKLADLVAENAELLAAVEAWDNGRYLQLILCDVLPG
jgi:aldehyde dehydrogenase (NAD(P)+)